MHGRRAPPSLVSKSPITNRETTAEFSGLFLQGLTCGTYQRPAFGWDAIAVTGGLCLLLVFIVYATCSDLINVSTYAGRGVSVRAW